MPFKSLFTFILMSLLLCGCSLPKEEKKVPVKDPPSLIPPNPPAVPYDKRVQLNSGSTFGTTANGFKTSVSLGNSSSELSGTTANGYRVKFNVQNPNSVR